jgi:hypothetical protein
MMPHWTVAVERHGTEAFPIVVIDNFDAAPGRFIDDAECLDLRPMGEHYPGLRANVPRPMLAPLLAALAPIIADVFGIAAVSIEDALYSLVTVPPDALKPIQRLPHFDGVEADRLALLHYLSPLASGGTAFYRHRGTGFESLSADRLPAYRLALDADLQQHGMPLPGYIAGNTGIYEQVVAVAGHFNRALLYRGNLLHCADIPLGLALPTDVRAGRFTVNTFLRSGTCRN